jgi:GntR family transcriptional regulator/MocR family aminotransferase
LLNLRYALADYLFRARAMVVDRDQIIITVGEQEALDILVRLAESTSTRLCIEDPCYKGAAMIFLNDGRPVQPVPVNDDGIMIDRLPHSPHNLLYVSPPHQFPTGAMLPLERRRALLQWAESTDSLIIEDDYDGDFIYDRPPIAPLASLNGNKRVMYINALSQTVGASVRVGYCVVPQKYAEAARELKG